ncbi:tetratricopeptide repeat protein [Aurantibacter crassamenti]|uniref:tetratricopeptide repeat-containing sensor histidine kinase n=1 Tax=Aurantibacter crassamenti TaxID=1837375 RepID=UPI001939C6EF|nr:ATP-binding protein [Aurantibacter crassamenti]MBM1107167.1 tetratricopeptide repeat protein [Aurantibacter crassamenti]
MKILLDESYKLSINSNYKKGESKVLYNYGHYFSEQGEKEKSLEYNLKSLEIANKHGLKSEKIKALNYMGLAFWHEGNNGNALTKYLEALTIAEEIEDTYMMSAINDNIALLYGDNADYETALAFHEKSRQISLKHNKEISLARTLLNMAVIYRELQDLDIADEMTDRCVKVFTKENSIDWLSHSFEVKGSIAIKHRKFSEALEWYSKSEKLCDEIEYILGYTKTYIGLAESYLGLKNLELAEEYAYKALQVSTDLSNSEAIKEANSILANIYSEMGEHKKAYEFQSEYLQLYKMGATEDFKQGLGVVRSELLFENQKNHLIEENNKAIAEQRLYFYLALSALFVATLFLIMIARTNKLQKKFTKILQKKQAILVKRESELRKSNETKDKLFSVIAHDLKGPINSFYSLMKLYLEKGYTKEESEKLFPRALQGIHGISEMLNNLLLWAKTQMQGAKIKPQQIDVNDIVDENIVLLNPLAERKAITIVNNIAENTLSFSDKDYISIVLRNLISNAIKFTNRNGEININAIVKGNELEVSVQDNGVGMDLETQAKLFKEDNNIMSTYGTNNEKGTGLGLSLSGDLVESNGGRIWVKSIKNKGTTMYFTMPIKSDHKKGD